MFNPGFPSSINKAPIADTLSSRVRYTQQTGVRFLMRIRQFKRLAVPKVVKNIARYYHSFN